MSYFVDKVFVPSRLLKLLSFCQQQQVGVTAVTVDIQGTMSQYDVTGTMAGVKNGNRVDFTRVSVGLTGKASFSIDASTASKIADPSRLAFHSMFGHLTNPYGTENGTSFLINKNGDLIIFDELLIKEWKKYES